MSIPGKPIGRQVGYKVPKGQLKLPEVMLGEDDPKHLARVERCRAMGKAGAGKPRKARKIKESKD